jgi:tRNA pseudouridine38-40 synthase
MAISCSFCRTAPRHEILPPMTERKSPRTVAPRPPGRSPSRPGFGGGRGGPPRGPAERRGPWKGDGGGGREPRQQPIHTYKLTIEYDGTKFSGWQDQQNARTVVGELRAAIADAKLPLLDLGGAGRTDAGVHALAQVAHLRLAHRYEPIAIQHALNDRLPASVHLIGVAHADPRFHARHDAEARAYLYQLSRRRTAFAKPYVWWIKSALDADRIDQALALLPGRHDFQLFAADDPDDKSTLVEVEGVEMKAAGDLLLLRFVASHFLWRMVRRLVGALARLGTGQLELEEFQRLLNATPLPPDRGNPAQWTAPPSGLFLERVLYAGDPALPPLRPATPVGR